MASKVIPMQSNAMTSSERRTAVSLAGIFSLRMLGLFMILPVFALYADHLSGVTPALVGLAIGIYGLSQALLQIPFGVLSDHYGRKRIITLGLLVFALGSVVAALSTSIWGVIVGRAMQGAGAVSGPVMALAADLTREEQRTKAMAIIGLSIGVSFAVAIVTAPVLNHWIGVPGIFWLIAMLAALGIVVLHTRVPNPVRSLVHRDAETLPSQLGGIWGNLQLRRLDFGILVLHLIITANWVVLPLALRNYLPPEHHWWIYLPVLILSVIVMVPFIVMAERKGYMKLIFLGAIATLGLAEFALSRVYSHSLLAIAVALIGFFSAFNLLEATLPSLVSRVAPSDAKGTAMGIYSTSQFLGAFCGGVMGGWISGHMGMGGVFYLGTAMTLLWLAVALGMEAPRALRSRLLHVGEVSEEEARHLAQRLNGIPGVAEAVVIAQEGIAYLKVDQQALDEGALSEFLAVEV
jgi:MFS family permease